ncbi:syndecan isoform X3 [Condylostylus longicornis]|uniref:syndecan isoform X3 n=1 Tax=Condylostylus longicornis TaxID=2530218 RepID=UPI00244E354B|nr:syndecan isoform X3 [Condylostylus longicornis]
MTQHKEQQQQQKQHREANMYHRIFSKRILTYALLFGLIMVTNATTDEIANSESKPPKPFSTESSSSVSPITNHSISSSGSSNSLKDEIYIDDEGIEGSGGRGEIHDDLEKEPDYSGSGFGPDDEDSGTSRISHNKNTHNKSPSNNNNNNRQDTRKDKNRHDQDIGGGGAGGNLAGSDIDHNKPTDQQTNGGGNDVLIMNAKNEDRTTSFFAQPGILAAVIGGAVVGLLCAILVVMFIVYRMRKKDEGSYALDEPKRSPAVNSYAKNGNNREFYA